MKFFKLKCGNCSSGVLYYLQFFLQPVESVILYQWQSRLLASKFKKTEPKDVPSNHQCVETSQCNADALPVRFWIGQENIRGAVYVNKREMVEVTTCFSWNGIERRAIKVLWSLFKVYFFFLLSNEGIFIFGRWIEQHCTTSQVVCKLISEDLNLI